MLMSRPLLLAVSLFVAAAFVVHPASAQDKAAQQTAFKLAVIDVEMIRRNATAVKDIQTQVAKFRTAFQADIQKEEDALRKAQQEVVRQRTILAPEAFAEERRKFEQNVISVQRKVEERKHALDRVQAEAMIKVERAVNEIVAAMVKEHGLSLILKRADAVFVTPQLEISQVVLEKLNKALPSITVAEPGK